jgi:hypothetical protein
MKTLRGNKLAGHVEEGVWVGFDEQSNGSCIYWPAKQIITVELNIYFDSPATIPLKGEEIVVEVSPALPDTRDIERFANLENP